MKGVAPLLIFAAVLAAIVGGALVLKASPGIPMELYVCDQKDVDVVMITDISGSMDDNCGPDGMAQNGEYPCKVNSVITASESLASSLINGNINDKVGVVAFNTYTKATYSLTRDIPILNAQIEVLRSKVEGMTCIECALNDAQNILMQVSNTKKVAVLLSDGIPNRCVTGACTHIVAKDYSIQKARAIAQAGMNLYVIGYDLKDENISSTIVSAAETRAFLQQVANEGNGRYFEAVESDISDIYAEIASILLCQTCDNDGICDSGETHSNCAADCPSCDDGNSCTTDRFDYGTHACVNTFGGTCQEGQTESRACGKCGTQQRSCLSICNWGTWGTCSGEKTCTPDSTQSCAVGGIPGTQRCQSICEWAACSQTGVCVPGSISSCGDCGRKTCSSSGQWGSCGIEPNLCGSGYVCNYK